jgi:ABC-2 type transport system permease protein
MNKILAVLKREYLTRVKKKSFVIFTILGPVLMALLMGLPSVMMMLSPSVQQQLALVDLHGGFAGPLEEALSESTLDDGRSRYLLEKVDPGEEGPTAARQELNQRVLDGTLDAYLVVEQEFDEEDGIRYFARNISFNEQQRMDNALYKTALDLRLADSDSGLDRDELRHLTRGIEMSVVEVAEGGEEQVQSEGARVVSFAVNYIFIFLFYMMFVLWGVAIMRGVIEEKSSRIIEVLLSSVTPFQLMMGKVVGISLVGLTQMTVYALSGVGFLLYGSSQGTLGPLLEGLSPAMFGYMILFYVLGYFLYATLYAAVGAVCNTEQEAQQAQTPVILLLIIPLSTVFFFINNPTSMVAQVVSLIPFFTPFIMMVRINTVTPAFWQIALSIVLLIGANVGMIWLVGKIFRVGILMYGKRPGPMEILRWLRRS